jgi:hypothetical protein
MAVKAAQTNQEHWDKLIKLIALAKENQGLSDIMRHGKPSEVVAALRDQVGLSGGGGDDPDDLELIADRGSVRWWARWGRGAQPIGCSGLPSCSPSIVGVPWVP